ncbi:MAG: molybdenum cofactor guanylyltransferase [Gemmatimonadota bacterium]
MLGAVAGPPPQEAAGAGHAGLVLAGGLSSRMGRPKALLPLRGVPLLKRVVDRLREVVDDVVVVGSAEQELPEAGARVVRDLRAQRGPLGGLEVGLASVTGLAFATSCDAPWLQPALVRRMLELASGFEAAVPRWGGRLQPLAAVYDPAVLPAVRRLLDAERLRPAFLFDAVRTRVVEEEELRDVDPTGLSFQSVNTPEEYAAALAVAPVRVTFELFGQPRVLAGRPEAGVDVPPPATLREALAALARATPTLVGTVLRASGAPAPGFLVSLDGREFTLDLDREVADGARLLLVSSAAGG